MKKYLTLYILCFISLLSLFLNIYKKDIAPLCFNADEAAFAYNSYSILQTGKDEYGTPWPLRLKSFGDYKMPLYSYLSTPFIATSGLNETSARALNTLIAVLLPIIIYLFAKEIFQNEIASLSASLLTALSLGLHILGRHSHEAYLSVFLTTLAAYLFIKVLKKPTLLYSCLFFTSITFLIFSYHPGRIFAIFFFIYGIFHILTQTKHQTTVRKKLTTFLAVFVCVLALLSLPDILYKPDRVKNLLFFNNIGFSLKIDELRAEGGSRLLYNKLTAGAKEIINQHAKYYSPQFLAIDGDENNRFGFPAMGPVTIIEYLFLFIGLYFLFKNKQPWRYLLVGLLLVSPISASLSWAGLSLTRSLFLLIIVLIIAGYGLTSFIFSIPRRYRYIVLTVIVVCKLFFLFYSWDFYLNHYPKRARTIRSWQCGYRELADYVKANYEETNRFYITKKNGEPYILLLFYLQYSPEKYQQQAYLTAPDEYGFGQVERFDKFEFNFKLPENETNYTAIGYPDDFAGANNTTLKNIKKIKVGTEEIFWIYEEK